jgi:hypothetical protein
MPRKPKTVNGELNAFLDKNGYRHDQEKNSKSLAAPALAGKTVWKSSVELPTPGATEVLTVLRDGGYKLSLVDRGPVRYTYHTTAPVSVVSEAIRQVRATGLQFAVSGLQDLSRMGIVT